ncbi:NPCBM-associated, NEW3 domain of alpha-galactosidase [Edaphobacillus lindanitolerans]|uniref:NPCBM-associated, NEW3 domain of alpha-galactosidase n=2 Tax=Edaphobacillus lindanitolerans TaxID=550447 RepID=A0A1U7PIK9_9BACI|nr:NEW3 domain-containing protein [Edaphobacillus lindanitolerans]SIT74508.1 NPCBM-associated, NEW3 domain of alpha-galactosidase [Edaphobacillus lindanitolerans]
MKRLWYGMLSVLLVTSLMPGATAANEQAKPDTDLWSAVKPLETTVTFLNTGAHPDDERSDFLAYLSRGLGVKTASLIANRGEGGQNAIGNELGNGLGIIRSNEMVEAAKVNGVKAYHLSETTSDPIYDFGFSKSPDETLEKWGEDVTYSRLIRFIRTYQPDIVMPSFLNVDSQHGHHRAMNVLSVRAFEDAADPSVFPEQLKDGLEPWQIKKLYLPVGKGDATTSIEIGDYDPIYEMSYPQLGEASRYLHKSQGMGREIPVEPRQTHLQLVASAEDDDSDDLFAGIPYDFNEWADAVKDKKLSGKLADLQKSLDGIVNAYPDRAAILPKSQKALDEARKLAKHVEKSKLDGAVKHDLLHKLQLKEEQLGEVSLLSSDLQTDIDIGSYVLTKGEETEVTVRVTNTGKQKVHHVEATLLSPDDWRHEGPAGLKHLNPGESKTATFKVSVPEDAGYFEPYAEPALQVKLSFKENGVETSNVLDLDNTVSVLPELSVTPDPVNITVNTAEAQNEIPVKVKVKNYKDGAAKATVSLKLPDGWTSVPESAGANFAKRFDEETVGFKLIPPETVQEGEFNVGAVAEMDGETFNTTVQEIKYEHINDSYDLYPSLINGVAFELLKPEGLKVGYIDSGFDQMADSFINAGFDITKLTPEDLANGDLSRYDTIVTGIRATLGREDLLQNNERIKEYVRNGGHFVMQYVTAADPWDADLTPPYRLKIGTPSIEWRVTDEHSEVTMTKPDHPLFNYPNKIGAGDWDNWVQERGLYFPMEWDDRYETFVSMADPGEDPFTGGILMADYGEGTYLYTNLVFYRQVGAQVPGGYRIFANLMSYGAYK